MMQRVWIMTVYFTKSLFFSLTGLIVLILSLIYWVVLFPPGQGTPDPENYIILVGALGVAATFLTALALTARAARLENFPMLVRLPSRIEYLTAILLSSLLLGLAMQALVAGLALIRGPELTTARWLAIPPLWLSVNLLAAVLALHVSDLVTVGWSRVILFGVLAALLILRGVSSSPDSWLVERLYDLASFFGQFNFAWLSDAALGVASGLGSASMGAVSQAAGIVFWPFTAMTDAVLAGGFTPSQALAPAVLMLYGSILFLIAATLFAGKDLEFSE